MLLNLRDTTQRDIELTYYLKINSIKPYVEEIWGWDEVFQKKTHDANFKVSNTKIIENYGQAVGYLVLKNTVDDIFIENILIENKYQNLGIGKAVMLHIIEIANCERKVIRLQVFKINIKAQNFYKQHGFEIISETEHHIKMRKNALL